MGIVAPVRRVPGPFGPVKAWPVTFDACFGWLHSCVAQPPGNTAVILCAGLTDDKITGHRTFRALADILASKGYSTLRFDYPGAGDSSELDGEDNWTAWQKSIGGAIDWLRGHTGAKTVVLIGLRIGATLAAAVAEKRGDVDGLILLEPVLRGRTFIRQLSIEQLATRLNEGSSDGSLEAHELLLPKETVRRINQVDLLEIRLPLNCAVAIFSRSVSLAIKNVLGDWRGRGLNVKHYDFQRLEPFLRPTFMSHEACADLTEILDWLQLTVPAEARRDTSEFEFEYSPLKAEDWIETPLFFGPRRELFGMLCCPVSSDATDKAVIITNSSGDPHYGRGRAAVELARRLATEGIASLRMDFAGIGDSSSTADATHIMNVDRTSDIGCGLDALEERGYRRFAVHGVCTGAYHALQTALVDDRVNGLVLVNVPMFTWRAGDPIELILEESGAHYLRTLYKLAFYGQLFRNQLDISRSLRFLKSRALRRLGVGWRKCTGWLGFGHAGVGRTTVEHLARRQVKTLFIYAAGDVTLKVFEREFGKAGAGLRNATVRILPGLDHSLTRREMRQTVASHVVKFLNEDIVSPQRDASGSRRHSLSENFQPFTASAAG